MVRTDRILLAASAAVTLAVIGGCSQQASGPVEPAPPAPAGGSPVHAGNLPPAEGEHQHKPSAHGGIIVPIGRDNYHAEAVFEKDGVLRLYTLGNDEAKVIDVEAQPLSAFVRPEGGTEATSFILKPEPQAGDTAGQTSQFLGRFPRELWGKRVEVTIPTIRVGGERFRVGFKSADDSHPEAALCAPADTAEERTLYLTAGGLYTEADIKANGGVTASEKFRGFQPSHDIKPRPGDIICPVTLTKANPKCTWIVGGKTYEFCCPPCVEEFVKLAKEKPQEVKQPDEYRKR
jgi:hypothetical protein